MTPSEPDVHIDDVSAMVSDDLNHGSFRATFDDDPEAAGLTLVRQAVSAGFAEVFEDRAAAASALGGQVLPAPLGTVSKARADGSWKHRLIQDLRINGVNSAVGLPERLVLPRPIDLGKDLAEMAMGLGQGGGLRVGIVDFADAFMSVPLAGDERRFNCAELASPIALGRPPLHPAEPPEGRLIAWRVLGFGGRPNPLVFGRITSMVMRCAQAILSCRADGPEDAEEGDFVDAVVRSHLYVDDAAIALAGSEAEVHEAFDLFLLFLLALGAPIAWNKVVLHALASGPVRWIGVDFDLGPSGSGRLRLPPDFVEDLASQVAAAARHGGRISDAEAQQLIGRTARVAYVAPAAAPFAAALRVALAAARETACTRRKWAQRSSHSTARFSTAASWFLALLRGMPLIGRTELPLERLVVAGGLPQMVAGQCDTLLFDASPWGEGAVWVSGTRPVECLVLHWNPSLCEGLQVKIGESKYLPFFEALTALAAIRTWCGPGQLRSAAVVGDNLAALTVAVSHRGRGDLGRVCRELALFQARWGIHLAVGHLPSELNTWADTLSRQFAPEAPQIPEELAHLPCPRQPDWSTLFQISQPVSSGAEPVGPR